jgi:hypothetical protein
VKTNAHNASAVILRRSGAQGKLLARIADITFRATRPRDVRTRKRTADEFGTFGRAGRIEKVAAPRQSNWESLLAAQRRHASVRPSVSPRLAVQESTNSRPRKQSGRQPHEGDSAAGDLISTDGEGFFSENPS